MPANRVLAIWISGSKKQRSVARILGAVVGSLGLVLVVICAYALKLAVTRYSDSNRIVSLAVASRDLTNDARDFPPGAR